MKQFSISMAIVDYIPVLFFTVAAIMLQRDLYSKMSKGAFALFAAGTIDIMFAGFSKATYKLLYATGICDLQALNTLFFPVQSIGFLLAGIGILAMIVHKQTENAALAVAPPFVKGTFFFVGLMCVGLFMIYLVLCVLAIKLKKPILIIVFIVSFLCTLFMGYLSTKDFNLSYMNWIAQSVNIVAQGLLLYGAFALRKAGLASLILNK